MTSGFFASRSPNADLAIFNHYNSIVTQIVQLRLAVVVNNQAADTGTGSGV